MKNSTETDALAVAGNATSTITPRGRFAPSPTGPLHLGSIVAALASYLDARHRRGRWSVRIDDIDPPRVQPGAAASILATLEACGFEWDGAVTYQSARHACYEQALARLCDAGRTFPCACTRKDFSGRVYPGTCRDGIAAGRSARTLRLRIDDGCVRFDDRIAGAVIRQPAREFGDFVLRRAGGHYAYHLACVVDDADAGITHIVRGADLLDSTAPQIVLQGLLGYPTPNYAHIPVVVNAAGDKLSKQTFAAPIERAGVPEAIFTGLQFLRQDPPVALHGASPAELLAWAIPRWRIVALRPGEPPGTPDVSD